MTDISHVLNFLPCRTPRQWLEVAKQPENLPVILIDHANNELKAAQGAMALINRYRTGFYKTNEDGTLLLSEKNQFALLNKMSRLSREEMRHYEQVLAILKKRNIPYTHLSAGRYAGRMEAEIRTFEPARLLDSLIMGAFIEARSCERFSALATYLDETLQDFYQSLLKTESRHFEDYLVLAEAINGAPIADRIAVFAEAERKTITETDDLFRFHSGVPV